MIENDVHELINDIALNGSRASFKRLYLLYYNRLFRLAKSFVKLDEAAEEIVDDVFLNLWTQRLKLPEISNFPGYCYTSVKNKSLSHISKARLSNGNLDDTHLEVADSSANGEDRLMGNDMAEIVNNSLSKLSEQCRLVFKLVKEDGLKYREVADLLQLSVKTVEYHMGNALKQVASGVANSQKSLSAPAQQNIS